MKPNISGLKSHQTSVNTFYLLLILDRKDGKLYLELESVVSILTAGPVGPGDKIGYMNRDLIMRSCNAEGLLLRPSKPVTSLDQQIHAKAFGSKFGPIGEAWSTYTRISQYTFGVLFAADIRNDYLINTINAGFEVQVSFLNFK